MPSMPAQVFRRMRRVPSMPPVWWNPGSVVPRDASVMLFTRPFQHARVQALPRPPWLAIAGDSRRRQWCRRLPADMSAATHRVAREILACHLYARKILNKIGYVCAAESPCLCSHDASPSRRIAFRQNGSEVLPPLLAVQRYTAPPAPACHVACLTKRRLRCFTQRMLAVCAAMYACVAVRYARKVEVPASMPS